MASFGPCEAKTASLVHPTVEENDQNRLDLPLDMKRSERWMEQMTMCIENMYTYMQL